MSPKPTTDTRQNTPSIRRIGRITRGHETSDGAGVELRRYIGTSELSMLDPFLLLDVFRSDQPEHYIAGFPPHPHRGFETVTYLLAGRFRHRDSAGHSGVLVPGGVQWMSAGSGIEHSEMPEQVSGLVHGFQLWINLPAAQKMQPPRYREFGPERVPVERTAHGGTVRVIAGRTTQGTEGPVDDVFTQPLYLDIELPPGESFEQALRSDANAFLFVIEGEIRVPNEPGHGTVKRHELATLTDGERLELTAGNSGARLLLIAGRPIREPVARHGPFVMNTRDELFQAYEDYRSGKFGHLDQATVEH